jgi:hypothetical protein
MSDSLREVVVQALDTRLRSITVANFYETDAGTNVSSWRDTPLDVATLPALVWRDTDATTPEAGALDVHRLNVEIDCVVSGTTLSTAMVLLRKVIADVVKALGSDLTLGGVVHDILQGTEEVHVQHEEHKLMNATLTFVLVFSSAHFDPYPPGD